MKKVNKKASFAYKLEGERIEAGISLLGAEVKSVKIGRVDISTSTARIMDSEAYLINANIPVPNLTNYSSTRTRKLLLHRGQLTSLSSKMKQRKLTLVPTSIYTKGRLVKIQLALGKPKRKFEKRQSIKKKDIEREIAQEFKNTGTT
ncbi:SsrA-binding protein SmpB [Patescibacteria group bacterium]